MKYKSKIYAKALIDIVTDKKVDQSKIIGRFFKLLEKNGDMKKVKEIVALAEKLFFKKTGKKKIVLETARDIKIKNLLNNIFGLNNFIVEKINPEIVAGVKIIVDGEQQLDFSLQSKLDKIFS